MKTHTVIHNERNSTAMNEEKQTKAKALKLLTLKDVYIWFIKKASLPFSFLNIDLAFSPTVFEKDWKYEKKNWSSKIKKNLSTYIPYYKCIAL